MVLSIVVIAHSGRKWPREERKVLHRVLTTVAALALALGPGVSLANAGPLHGNCDQDGDVDLQDYAMFVQSIAGPGGRAMIGQQCVDFDWDGDVDVHEAL